MQISKHRFFTVFDPPVAARLEALCEIVPLADGQVLFRENDPPDAFYLVLDGRIELYKELADGRTESIAWVEADDYFGELAVLDGSGRSTTARAAGPTRLGRLPGADFLEVMRTAPGRAALSLFGKIITNMRTTNDRFMAHKLSQEKLSLVGEMAGSVVHDLRNPFGGIKLAIEMIEEEHRDPQTLELCAAVGEQVRRSLGMLDDLLQFSRGVPSLNVEMVSLRDLLGRFDRLNAAYLAQTPVRLEIEVEDVEAELDVDKMMRVLQNLINNAVEAFGEKGGTVAITCRPTADGAVLRVSDDGPGIPEPIRDRLFDAFVTHGKANGTGLGTAITRSLVEAHGGTIDFTTATGQGTTFIIELPRHAKRRPPKAS